MSYEPQMRVKATYMRGGTSKGTFFNIADLPKEAQEDKVKRDKLLQRIVGSPDIYKQQMDGMGGATSSTSKAILVGKSTVPNHDVDYYFGQVAIDKDFMDWSGNCGNLSSAVGPFAIHEGLVDNVPQNGVCCVRIWQANIKKTILCYVTMVDGQVKEMGDYYIDGVAFPAEEILLEFAEPVDPSEELFPTGNLVDDLEVPGIGTFKATMITAGIPTIFLNATDIGYKGTELQADINSDAEALARFEKIRSYGALKMGLISDLKEAETRQHTPKIAFVAPKSDFITSSGKEVKADEIDLHVRALSMQKLHHAMMGTASVAIGVAACIEGTLVNLAAGGGEKTAVEFGHPSGTLKVGAVIKKENGKYIVDKATMSRSARIIMKGEVYAPADIMK
ncbi:2-methylaconitate cis-trans isomerase PrpF [Aliarcobacter butzleri]|uniref:2-methylaconitate cis-trans isomerase PrpF n=1 Tax=Aliarcobacter butzleri TaxID=28197 RepID=A0AAP4UZ44_9BACT|nr:2-methylaconitate cis-trans isomerase PrpF [Aliarcobacter butzleri]MCT7573786.1 2-methylaconitate cis-trans isomerase PrpF [Aliarcobacter butzleri]MDN5052662.1 2-methylaconitate cis-trans isomerase PrpF [Aliarcobacter butzleri]MDN5074127.1 2-methylaconitate cis-trans isomerase PrpF [Aliarcobacter butzleri]MDN5116967.1 2-methylaconitate cis-trans isomerase PrpF [Aliarcobacter butzleri]MDN5132980.1 2-methylaconitate cis-trans isomerase PrpF [Aliarcobacter butzleri]